MNDESHIIGGLSCKDWVGRIVGGANASYESVIEKLLTERVRVYGSANERI